MTEIESLSTRRSIKNLVHACRCKDDYCSKSACHQMKRDIDHAKQCKRKGSNKNCSICKGLSILCCYHAKHCHEPSCSIPFCPIVKMQLARRRGDNNMTRTLTIFQQQQQQQQRNDSTPPPNSEVTTTDCHNAVATSGSTPTSTSTPNSAVPSENSPISDESLSSPSTEELEDEEVEKDNTKDTSIIHLMTEDFINHENERVVESSDNVITTSFKYEDIHEPETTRIDTAKAVQCVECNEIPIKEIYSCEFGHLICDKCRSNYSTCSICPSPMTNTRNLLAEALVSSFVFKCPHLAEGCTHVFTSANMFRHLEQECAFRPVPCHVDDEEKHCNGKLISFGQYLTHVKARHRDCVEDFTVGEKCRPKIRSLQCDSVTENYIWPLSCILYDGQLFFQHTVFHNSTAYIWVSIFGLPHVRQSYCATVSLVKQSPTTKQVMKVKLKIPVKNFRKSFEDVMADGDAACMILSREEFLVFSSTTDDDLDNGQDNEDVMICKYIWTLHTTISKC